MRDHLVNADQLNIGNRRPFDPHRRESNRSMAAEGVEHPGFQPDRRQSPRLGDEQRVPGSGVTRAHLGVVVVVNVGREQVDPRCPRLPDVDQVGHGAAALPVRALAGFGKSVRPPVHIHRQRVLGFARLGHPVDVARELPAHEDLIPRGTLPENLVPRSGGFEAGRLPYLAKLRNQGVLVLLQIVHQLLRHRSLVGLFGQGRVVAATLRHPDFVLHLDHDDRVLRSIHLLDVPHQGRKGEGIGVAVRLAERAEEFNAPALHDLGAREPREVPLHPIRRVGGPTVFPAGEPQQHETQVVIPRFPDHAVQHAEVELPFLGFDLGPGNRRQNAVEPCVDELGPDPLHVFETGGGVVAQFSRQREERLAVHDQLNGGPLLSQVGDFRSRGRCDRAAWRRTGQEGKNAHEEGVNRSSKSHDHLEGICPELSLP